MATDGADTSFVRQPWRRWCRLCAKDDPFGNLNVFSKNKFNVPDKCLSTAIGKYFWVNIKPEEVNSKYICQECHALIDSLNTFSERVNKVQAMFSVLENTKSADTLDTNALRMQYGLLEDDWEHIIRCIETDEVDERGQQQLQNFDCVKKEEQEEEDDVDEMGEMEEEEQPEEEQPEEEHPEEQPEGEQLEEEQSEGERPEEEYNQPREFNFVFADDEETQVRRVNRELKQAKVHRTDLYEDSCEGLATIVKAEEHMNLEDEELDDFADSNEYNDFKYRNAPDIDIPDEYGEDVEDTEEAEEELYLASNNAAMEIAGVKRKRGRPSKSSYGSRKPPAKKYTPRDDTDSRKYVCRICEKRYVNPTSYRKHMLVAHKSEPDIPDFQCDKCAMVMPTEKQLALHKRKHMTLEEKLDMPCPYCEKKFSHRVVLRQHVRAVHENEKPYICDECGRAMKTMAALNDHKLVHTTDCPFECEVCRKSFKNKARLKIHADTHTETAYVCTECGLQLNTRRTLKMHMLVHTDEKQFKCDFCNAEFKRSKALKNHLILHTGLRPYTCNFCGRTFSNGSNCRSHKRKLHPKELAEEEAQGNKKRVIVPKLDDLRSCSNIVENPRKVQRHSGGLPQHLRDLLLAAEQRAKRREESGESSNSPTIRIKLHNGEQGSDSNENDDDDGEETVIYEIIDEI